MSKRLLNHQRFQPFEKGGKHYDIAIIGGGISGVYTAWRLKQAYPEKKIALFEYSNRIGGRLYSYTMPGMPNLKAELGGMRWLLSHKIVVGLIDHLKLRTREFPMGADGGSNNLMYLRRRQLRVKDLNDPAKVPYLLNPDEQGMNPDQLQAYVMNSLLPFNKELTAQQWWTVPVLNGTPLYKMGFWNLLYQVLSSEAYQYMNDAGGYYTNVANSTAPLSLPITEYDPSNKYYTLTDGFEQLPRTVARCFEALGGELFMNHRLDSFGRRKDQQYALHLIRTHTDERGKTEDAPDTPPSTWMPTAWCWRCPGAPSSSSAGTAWMRMRSSAGTWRQSSARPPSSCSSAIPIRGGRRWGSRPGGPSPTCPSGRPTTSAPRARTEAAPRTTTRC
jgi:hypothetical protein